MSNRCCQGGASLVILGFWAEPGLRGFRPVFPQLLTILSSVGSQLLRAPAAEGGEWQVQTLRTQGKGGSEVRLGQVSPH